MIKASYQYKDNSRCSVDGTTFSHIFPLLLLLSLLLHTLLHGIRARWDLSISAPSLLKHLKTLLLSAESLSSFCKVIIQGGPSSDHPDLKANHHHSGRHSSLRFYGHFFRSFSTSEVGHLLLLVFSQFVKTIFIKSGQFCGFSSVCLAT